MSFPHRIWTLMWIDLWIAVCFSIQDLFGRDSQAKYCSWEIVLTLSYTNMETCQDGRLCPIFQRRGFCSSIFVQYITIEYKHLFKCPSCFGCLPQMWFLSLISFRVATCCSRIAYKTFTTKGLLSWHFVSLVVSAWRIFQAFHGPFPISPAQRELAQEVFIPRFLVDRKWSICYSNGLSWCTEIYPVNLFMITWFIEPSVQGFIGEVFTKFIPLFVRGCMIIWFNLT